MNTFRHNLDLIWNNKKIIAPRKFIINHERKYYVHILDSYCQYVQLFDHLRFVNNTCVEVAKSNILKLHSNSKGLYFNYSYWVNSFEKKTIRVYICD